MIPGLIFLVAFGFLLLGVNPSFYVDDSPETITAATLLGIPHPPGYPFYTLLGRVSSLIPLSHVTFRVNLISGCLAAAVCVALYFFIKDKVQLPKALALIISSLWLCGATTYPAALSAKTGIYHLTALFLVTILLALGHGRLFLASFLFGLSLSHHWMSMAVLSPGFIYIVINSRKERNWGWHHIIDAISIIIIGLSINLYLPMRAHLRPMLNWGNPDSAQNFISNYFRGQYLGAEASGELNTWITQLGLCLRAGFLEFFGLMILAIWGAWNAYKKGFPLFRGMILAWMTFFLVLSFYLNLSQERQYLIQSYVLCTHVFIIIFSAWAIKSFFQTGGLERKRGVMTLILAILFMLIVLGMGVFRYARARQTDYCYTYDYVLNEWKSLPKNSLFYCRGDSVVFPSWYFQWVEGKRPDLSVVGVDGLPMEWIRQNLALFHPGLQVPFTKNPVGNEAISGMANWMAEKNSELELYFSFNQPDEGLMPGTKLVPYGLAAKVFWKDQKPFLNYSRAEYLWNVLRLRYLHDPAFPFDKRTREQLIVNYGISRNSLGVYYEDLGDDAKEKLSSHPKMQDLLTIQSAYEKSADHFSWVRNWDPSDSKYAYNLGNSFFHLGRLNDAMECYRTATTLESDYPEAYYNWAVAAMDNGDYPLAGKLFQKALELNPGYAEAKRGLDFVVRKTRISQGQ